MVDAVIVFDRGEISLMRLRPLTDRVHPPTRTPGAGDAQMGTCETILRLAPDAGRENEESPGTVV